MPEWYSGLFKVHSGFHKARVNGLPLSFSIMDQNNSKDSQPDVGLRGEDGSSDMNSPATTDEDAKKFEKAMAELKVLKAYLKKQESEKNDTNKEERNDELSKDQLY